MRYALQVFYYKFLKDDEKWLHWGQASNHIAQWALQDAQWNKDEEENYSSLRSLPRCKDGLIAFA